jgi:hypothetical protein
MNNKVVINTITIIIMAAILGSLLIASGIYGKYILIQAKAKISDNQKEVVYIGGDIGDGAIGYHVYKLNRHGLCYELFRRGNSESFIIKVDCKGD